MKYILSHATIIEENGHNLESVEVGTTVTIQEEDYPPEVYYLVGSKEADPRNGRISNASPIGQAIMGRKVGDFVDVEAPGGVIKFKIIKIE